MERRDFLKRAAQGAFAVPAAASLGNFGLAQTAKPAKAPTNGTHATAEAHAGPKVTINVKDLGATGDGKTKDTLALQLAIDRCAALGGGEVVVPAGDYATGGLALRSDVTLRIEDGASLLGSGDMADYPVTEVRWEGRWIKGYSAFISAVDAENVGIAGPGEIVASDAIRGRVERPSGMRLPRCLNLRIAATCAWRIALPARRVCGRFIPCIART